jgi:hypothetical protein
MFTFLNRFHPIRLQIGVSVSIVVKPHRVLSFSRAVRHNSSNSLSEVSGCGQICFHSESVSNRELMSSASRLHVSLSLSRGDSNTKLRPVGCAKDRARRGVCVASLMKSKTAMLGSCRILMRGGRCTRSSIVALKQACLTTDQKTAFSRLPWFLAELDEIISKSTAQRQIRRIYWNFHQFCVSGKSVPEFTE